MFLAICLLFYLLGAVLAFPIGLVLRRIWPGRRAYVRAAAFAGLVPAIAAVARTAAHGTISAFRGMYILIFFTLGGYAAGALYWRTAVRDRARDVDFATTFGCFAHPGCG